MQLEVILPLVAYLVVVFGISVYAMRKTEHRHLP
ncbi:sodium/panthothenate symporter [Escherichia coli]|nr:sodium/panthothenate symporter [Escherichia coli]